MRSAEERGFVLAKLEDGEDLLPALEGVASRHRIESGAVLWGIGMVRDFEVGYFDGREYRRRVFGPPHELLALHGSVTLRGDPRLHVHVAAGTQDHGVVGGHLFRGTVSTLNEVMLARFDAIRLGREVSPASGLRELTVGKESRARRPTRARRPRRGSRPR